MKFVQIAAAAAAIGADGEFMDSLYALGDDGHVYEYCWRERVWKQLPSEVEERDALSQGGK